MKKTDAVEALVFAMGKRELDFYAFYFLKRVDKAYQVCSENNIIPEVQFYSRVEFIVL